MKIQGILIAILIIATIAGWSASAERGDTIKEYQKQIKDLEWEVRQLQSEIDCREDDLRILEDDLSALGYRPVDLTKETGGTNRSSTFEDVVGDSRFWNKHQDIDKYFDKLLSGSDEFSGYDMKNLFRLGEWDAIDRTTLYWEKLKDNGIISVIVVGNLDLHGETLSESNHSWLLVFYKDWDKDGWSKTKPLRALIFEPTQRYSIVIHIPPDTSIQYKEGYFYASPFELEADIKEHR